MKHLKLAASASVAPYLQTARLVVDLRRADYADVAAIIISVGDLNHGRLADIETLGFGIPAFVAVQGTEQISPEFLPLLKGVITLSDANQAFYASQIESAAQVYEEALLPPVFDTLKKYVEMENATFACPGHQGDGAWHWFGFVRFPKLGDLFFFFAVNLILIYFFFIKSKGITNDWTTSTCASLLFNFKIRKSIG